MWLNIVRVFASDIRWLLETIILKPASPQPLPNTNTETKYQTATHNNLIVYAISNKFPFENQFLLGIRIRISIKNIHDSIHNYETMKLLF